MGSMLSPPSPKKPADRVIASICAPAARPRAVRRREAGDLYRPGFRRLTVDIPAEDFARFKATCALHKSTMHNDICAFIQAVIGAPDALLSKMLFLESRPNSKRSC